MKESFKKVLSLVAAIALIFSLENGALAAGLTPSPNADNITVTNNAGIADTVQVTGLNPGDVVKVYNTTTQVGTATVATGKTSAVVSIAQLGSGAGSVFVSVTASGSLESNKVSQTYIAEVTSVTPSAGNITVTNNTTGTADTVKLTGLLAGDVVKVYKDGTVTTTLGTATVATGATTATVTITQLGTAAGSVFVSVTSKGDKESARTEKTYLAEAVTTAVEAAAVTIVNNAGIADTIKVTGLTATDVIKVYAAASGGAALGSATVAAGKTDATISVAQLGTAAGKAYVSVTSTGKLESTRTEVAYAAEATSATPDASKVLVINNVGTDLVVVYGLTAADVVKIYSTLAGTAAIATATVGKDQTYAVITIAQLGAAGGDVYIGITSPTKLEGTRLHVVVAPENN